MRSTRLAIVLTAAIALCATSCVSSRKASKSSKLRVEGVESVEKVDSIKVEHSDTLREVTTITVQLNDTGDTLKISTVTDRERIRVMSDVRSTKEDVVVCTDTVYIERDSVAVMNTICTNPTNGSKSSRGSIVQGLRWVFFVLLAIIALVIIIRLKVFK